MKLVRFGLLPLLLVAFASSAFAQASTTTTAAPKTKTASSSAKYTAKSPEEMAKNALAKWKGVLKLTPEQVPQFESVMTDSYKKMADAKTAAAGDKAKMKESMVSIMKDREDALAKILTPDQMKTYRAKMAQGSAKMKEHMEKSSASSSK